MVQIGHNGHPLRSGPLSNCYPMMLDNPINHPVSSSICAEALRLLVKEIDMRLLLWALVAMVVYVVIERIHNSRD